MSRRPVLLSSVSLLSFLITAPLKAQNKPVQCLDTCEPDPTSGSYAATYAARPRSKNVRASSTVVAPRANDTPGEANATLPGSESYSYAIPVLSLLGRNGLDVNLVLFYNSGVWTIDTTASTATFNADRDFPSYGFHLGYGLIEAPPSGQTSHLLTEPDGTKRELRFSSGSTYVTVDSSYSDWNSSTKILRRKDGTQWIYEQVPPATTFYRPIKIIDTDGNYISIAYSTATGADKQAISTITDTVNRVIAFNYDASSTPRLQNITVTPAGGSPKTVAYFSWVQTTLSYSFSLTVRDSLSSGSGITVLSSCAYANAAGTGAGTSYSFAYGDWGIVNKISRLSASGATRSYFRYDYPAATTALSDHPTYQHQYVSPDGTNENTFTYAVTKSSGVTSSYAVTDPAGTTSTVNLFTSGWQTGLVSTVVVSSGSTTYRVISNTWTQDNTGLSTPLNPRLTSASTTLSDSGQVSSVGYQYTTNGNVSDVFENDFGGVLVRKTHTNYQTATAYSNLHILDRPTQILVYDGSNNLKSRTDLAYDAGTLTNVGSAPQHDNTNYGTGFMTRGNVTSTTRYTNAAAGSGPVTRNFTFDILGNLLTAQLDCCQQKQWTFSSTTNYAYPDSITRGAGGTQLTTSRTYDLSTGAVTQVMDENSQQVNYSYDALNRPSLISGPLSASVSFSYDDNSAQPSVTRTTALDAGKSMVRVTTADGLGRTVKVETKDAAGQNSSIVETQYDAAGRVLQVSNPHGVSESPLWTQYQYDPLARVSKVVPTDGSISANNTQYAYSGNATTITDPAGKQRRFFTDALGRLSQVHEPGWGDATPGTGSVTISGSEQRVCILPGPPPPNGCSEWEYDWGTVSVTVGSFNASVNYSQLSSATGIANSLASQLNGTGSPVTASVTGTTLNLTARQNGSATNYALSASSSSNDPFNFPSPSFAVAASGASLTGGTDAATQDNPSLQHPLTTVYTFDVLDDLTLSVQGSQQRSFVYDSMGRLTQGSTPEAGAVNYTYTSFGLVATRTDARNVQASYQYDGLNRLVGVGYLLNGGAWSVMPNVCTPSGGTAANVCFAYGTSAASFNNGRITQMTDPTGTESYSYDALGRVSQMTKVLAGASYSVGYSYDYASNLKQISYPSGRVVQQSLDSLGRLSQVSSGGTNYVSSVAYNSAWEPTGFSYGNGVQATFGYNSRMQLQSLAYAKSGANLFGVTYGYTQNAGNNGQITGITDNVDGTRTTSVVYDAWDRIKSWSNAQATLTYTYDRYGNRLTQSMPVPSTVTVDAATNHITTAGYAYDAAGNMTQDNLNVLTFDGENRVATSTQSGTTYTYAYDGNGLRVKKTPPAGSATVYVFSGAKVLAEYVAGAAAGSPSTEYIYSGAQLAATISGGTTTYQHPDHLSARVATDPAGNTAHTFGHYPFGEVWYETGTASKWKFTTYERDAESDNDYAMARMYRPRLGRFLSPDPLSGSLADPQSLNRYTYSLNDPIGLSDPSGLISLPPLPGFNWDAFFPHTAVFVFANGTQFIGGGGGGTPDKLLLMLDEGSGGIDFNQLKSQAIVALLNPDCAALFGGFKNAITSLFNSSFNSYAPGQSNPIPSRISKQAWTDRVESLRPTTYGFTFWSTARPGGIIFFTPRFTTYSPGFPLSSDGFGQMTGFFHEFEHAANHNPKLDRDIDASRAAYDADYLRINSKCTPRKIDTQSVPITGELTPP